MSGSLDHHRHLRYASTSSGSTISRMWRPIRSESYAAHHGPGHEEAMRTVRSTCGEAASPSARADRRLARSVVLRGALREWSPANLLAWPPAWARPAAPVHGGFPHLRDDPAHFNDATQPFSTLSKTGWGTALVSSPSADPERDGRMVAWDHSTGRHDEAARRGYSQAVNTQPIRGHFDDRSGRLPRIEAAADRHESRSARAAVTLDT